MVNRYFFLSKFFQKFLFFVIFSTLSVFCGLQINILLYIRIRTVSVRKILYALSFFISFQNISRENVCSTFGHLVSQARARQSNAVVRLIKRFLNFCSPAFFI